MVSHEQQIKMLENLRLILNSMEECKSIGEISVKTGIPTSTIQRYLNRKDLLLELFGNQTSLCDEIFEKNQLWLAEAKRLGTQKGGLTTQERYSYEKDDQGLFRGPRKN